MDKSTTFKVITLLFAATFVAISITNAVYFYRLYRSIYNTVPALRNNLFGTNSLSSAYSMWIVNLLLAILSGLLFLLSIFLIAGIGMPGQSEDEVKPVEVTVAPSAVRQVQGATATTVRPVTFTAAGTTPAAATQAAATQAAAASLAAPSMLQGSARSAI